jgi:thiazole biosynthesis enzyme
VDDADAQHASERSKRTVTKFAPTTESQITRSIVEGFTRDLLGCIESDVVVAGAGPSGLIAARDLARRGHKVLVVESNNYLGGGFWIGGYLMNQLTVRAPAQEVLQDLGVPHRQTAPGLYAALAPHACSKLIASALDAGAKVLNMTSVDDVVLDAEHRVRGAVVNWTPVRALPRAITCVDPVAIEAEVVIDATGHDAVVASALQRRGLIEIKGMGALNIQEAEDAIVEQTGEAHPGLIITGMAVSTVYGLPRTGPTFGAMLLSGRRAAEVAEGLLARVRRARVPAEAAAG